MNMDRMYDAIIIGGGPSGLTAALYLARAAYRVLVIEKEKFGGQINITNEVVNYPGVFQTSGPALTEQMWKQADRFGAEFLMAEVEGLSLEGDIKTVRTSRGDYQCFGVLLATGARPRTIGFKGELEHRGRGVAYCATCDGEFFTGKDLYVIGGGFVAAEESVFLTKFARHVTMLIREEDFTCAKATADHAKHHEKIDIHYQVLVDEVAGENGLTYLKYHSLETGEVTEIRAKEGETFGVFVFAGYQPATELVKGVAELDKYGYIVTDGTQRTSVEGLFAAGDVCIKPLRQVVTAVSDGALAATELEKYCSQLHAKTNVIPKPPVQRSGEPEAPAPAAQGQGAETDSLFSAEMTAQLAPLFQRMAQGLTLRLTLDQRPISQELENYMNALAALTDKLSVIVETREGGEDAPFVSVCRTDGTPTGLAFHGVPGGHEFTSFVLGLYNAAGPGQSLDEELKQQIAAISTPQQLQVMVSLSCTMCPDLVVAAQRIAADNPNVSAHVYDLNHFPGLKERYQVMSVPCLVINGEKVLFGKKNVKELLDAIAQ